MVANPPGENIDVPTSADASRILGEITPVTQRSRQLARDVTMGRPLLAWGLAWIAGSMLFQFVPSPGGAIGGSLACAAAIAVNLLVRPREVRRSTERRFGLGWFVLMGTSPLLVAVAAPGNAKVTAVFLGSLWAVGMLLYGIGVRDLPLAAIGLAIVLVAAATRIAVPGQSMIIVGVTGGLAMAAVGAWRMRWKR
jgi:hypothetical protein